MHIQHDAISFSYTHLMVHILALIHKVPTIHLCPGQLNLTLSESDVSIHVTAQ